MDYPVGRSGGVVVGEDANVVLKKYAEAELRVVLQWSSAFASLAPPCPWAALHTNECLCASCKSP